MTKRLPTVPVQALESLTSTDTVDLTSDKIVDTWAAEMASQQTTIIEAAPLPADFGVDGDWSLF